MDVIDALPENVRFRLLRRVDWRFLLPNPQPTKSICFANGLLGKAVRLISDCVVDAQVNTPGDCDLAVVIDPIQATLQRAWAALRPGGSCYTEWRSPLAGGPKGVKRRLEAAGFEGVTCYWPWPSLSRSRFWLPLEAPGALRYFYISRPPARSVVRRMVDAGLRAVWRLSLRLGLLLPVCATAHKPALALDRQPSTAAAPALSSGRRSLSASGMDVDLLDTIRAGWSAWGFGPTPDHFSSLFLTGGHCGLSKVVRLVFAEPDRYPRLAVKMPRVKEADPNLMREAATLRALQTLRSDGVQGIPLVLFCHRQAGLLTVGETALTGRPLLTLLRRDTYRDLALQATDWLASLAGRPAPCPPVTWRSRLIEPVLTDFDESFGPFVDPGMRRETRDIFATLGALPLLCEHRDFGPWNVIMTANGKLAVLDWESSELQGLPALDLIFFLSFLALNLDGAVHTGCSLREAYRPTLDPSTLTGSVVSECLVRYASHVGFDLANLRPLRLLVWLLHARWEYRRFAADVAGRPGRETLRRSRFVSLWEEELRHGPGLLRLR
jgi:hypothetical protein